MDEKLRRRLWRHTVVDGQTGCWIWVGPRNHAGYGKITIAGHTVQVHRLAARLIGRPFDETLTLDHLCRNRACWNPSHLEAVTVSENILRGTGPTAVNARKTHCVHGHPLTPDNLRRRTGARAHHRECLTCWREAKARRRRAA